jgi:hypothetical protein
MGRWDTVVYLPVRMTNPQNGLTVDVNAKLEPGLFFDLYADLSEDVIERLRIEKGEEFQGLDEENDLVTFCSTPIRIAFDSIDVEGPTNINSKTNVTTLFGHFLDHIPNSVDVSRFRVALPQRQVFLSHSHKDRRFTQSLAKSLQQRGIGVWLDEAEIRIGESLIEKLRSAIDKVDFVVAIISTASVESPWVRKELDIAMNQEIEGKKVKVLPVLKEDCDLPGFLKGKLYADFRKKHRRSRAVDQVVRSILTLNA